MTEQLLTLKSLSSPQTSSVLGIFMEMYGLPEWLNDKHMDKIIARWNAALHDYSLEQSREAAYKTARYSRTFPTLSHVLSQLFDQPKEAVYTTTLPTQERYNIDNDPIRRRKVNFSIKDKPVLPAVYENAARYVLRDVSIKFPDLEGYSQLVYKAEALGWLDGRKIKSYIKKLS